MSEGGHTTRNVGTIAHGEVPAHGGNMLDDPRDALEGGGGVPPSPLQGAQPVPSHCLPDTLMPHAPAVTAHNRYGNLLHPPIQPLLGPPLRSLPF